jgi:hypothetical protein
LTSYTPEFLDETKTAKTGLPGQDSQGRRARTGLGGQVNQDGTRTGLPGKDSRQDRADKTGQRGMKSQDRTSSAEHPGGDCPDRAD